MQRKSDEIGCIQGDTVIDTHNINQTHEHIMELQESEYADTTKEHILINSIYKKVKIYDVRYQDGGYLWRRVRVKDWDWEKGSASKVLVMFHFFNLSSVYMDVFIFVPPWFVYFSKCILYMNKIEFLKVNVRVE